jgi:preprotein translocase subunit SecF
MNISFKPIAHRRVYLSIIGFISAVAIAGVVMFGLKPGIDFTGGALVEVSSQNPIATEVINAVVSPIAAPGYSVRTTDDGGAIIRTAPLSEEQRQALVSSFEAQGMTVERLNAIGPTLGHELVYKSFIAMTLVILAVLVYVAIVFSGVREPVGSWTYGGIVVMTLFHDVLIPVGLFAFLGQFAGYEVDSLFVTAMLVILGYSINDTIVIFDRVRENLKLQKAEVEKGKEGMRTVVDEKFSSLVERSIKETLARSLNTTVTTLISLIVLYFVGADSTKAFALALLAGVLAGAWSSLFFSAPMLVWFQERAERRAKRA